MKIFKTGISKLVLVCFFVFGFSGSLWAGVEDLSSAKASKILQIEYEYMKSGNYPLTPEGLNLEQFSKSQLAGLVQELGRSGVLIHEYPNKDYNSKTAAELALKHQKENDENAANEIEADKLVINDYAKLSWVLAKNSAIAVTDIYTSGAGGKIIKFASKSKYVWWAKEVSKLNKIAKLKILLDSKKYKFFVKIIETGFNIEETYQYIRTQKATNGEELTVDKDDFINYFKSQGIEILDNNGVMKFVNIDIAEDALIEWAKETVVEIFQEIASTLDLLLNFDENTASIEDIETRKILITDIEYALKAYSVTMANQAIKMTPILGSFVNTWEEAGEIASRITPEAYALSKNYFDNIVPRQQAEWDELHKKTLRDKIEYTLEVAYINYPNEVFEDVLAVNWFFNYVNTLIEKKSITTKNRNFNPITNISQYEFLVISSKLFYENDFQIYKAQNQSIEDQKIYFDFINSKLGIINNIEYIKKDISITRAQVAEILHKLIYLKKKNSKLPFYADASFSGKKFILFTLDKTFFGTIEPDKGWYYHPSFLRAINISNGYTNGNYGFNDNIKRSETAALLVGAYNFLEAN